MAQLTLTPAQRVRLIKIIANHPDVVYVSHRLNFLENVGLSEQQGKIVLGDTAEHFAHDLIRLCERAGTLPDTQQPALVNVILYLREARKGDEEDSAFLDSLLVQNTPFFPVSSPLSHETMMQMFTAVLDHRSAGELGQALDLLRELRRQNFETFLDLDGLMREVEAEYEKETRRQRMSGEYNVLARYIRDANLQQGRVAWDNFCKRYPDFNFVTDLPLDYLYPPTLEQERLLNVMLDVRIPPPQRAEAGRELSKIGDPRRGVGVLPNGIPDIVWCEVPGRDKGRPPSPIGGDNEVQKAFSEENSLPAQTVNLDTYWLAKYPITFQQYQSFIDDKGYETQKWWEGLQKRKHDEQYFKFANHPRESVTWYEAMAFCRWLSAKTKMDIRLPTEEEWEKAARGDKGMYYPWGNQYESGRANIDEPATKVGNYYLKTTTAVGLYPHGASPYGVLDMAGNVWEWMLSAWEAEIKQREQIENFTSHNDAVRVLRGSSWINYLSTARAAPRDRFHPDNRLYNIGFRVMLVVAPDR